jgi:phospholipid/cholesterol/gamma-HCH transport system permease protein
VLPAAQPAAHDERSQVRVAAEVAVRARRGAADVGKLYGLGADTVVALVQDVPRGRFRWDESVVQAWFLTSATLLPAVLVGIPLGIVIVLNIGGVAGQLGASSFIGAVDAVGVLREAAPIVTALLLAGAGGAAICADLGSRTIREEIDAMVVLGVDPVRRLVAPRVVAAAVVAMLLNFLVALVGLVSGYAFALAELHSTKGSFLASFGQFATVPDLVVSEAKAGLFGVFAALIASHLGLSATRGPSGVGDAVNRAVALSGVALFLINLVATELFFAFVPQTLI